MTNNIYLEALRELVSVFPVPLADYPDVAKKVHDALSQKPRNCDIGTAKEQEKRFRDGWLEQRTEKWRQTPFLECIFEWSQMPYEEALEK